MQWPSKNIPMGGVFHRAKVNYSPETKQFLQNLISETQMTTFQRNKINYSLRSGEPLPAISSKHKAKNRNCFPVIVRPGSSKRRSLDTIKKSGAYDREAFVPTVPVVDREQIKEELQDRMTYGKNYKPKLKCPPHRKSKAAVVEVNKYDLLKKEIEEREEWLKEMEELGEGEKHRSTIQLQIAERLREIERLKISDK